MPPVPPVEGPPAPESMQAKMTEEISNLEAPVLNTLIASILKTLLNTLLH